MEFETLLIQNWLSEPGKTRRITQYHAVWFSPDRTCAVIELRNRSTFLAVRVTGRTDHQLEADYVDLYEGPDDCLDFRRYEVDWTNIGYGFAYLHCFATESGFSGTVCRFYFDIELYKQKYFECNGVPYTGNKSFRVRNTAKPVPTDS